MTTIRVETDQRGLLITIAALAAFFISGALFLLGMTMADNATLRAEREALEIEVADNSATLNALSDRVIYLQEACSFIGRVSWYGDREAGHETANGERFNPDELSAASLFLQFHSRWKVTRLDTGASVTVRINDRIPGRHGRVLDLSREAALRLGMLECGVVAVRVEPGL